MVTDHADCDAKYEHGNRLLSAKEKRNRRWIRKTIDCQPATWHRAWTRATDDIKRTHLRSRRRLTEVHRFDPVGVRCKRPHGMPFLLHAADASIVRPCQESLL